jgi:hypothetical protein
VLCDRASRESRPGPKGGKVGLYDIDTGTHRPLMSSRASHFARMKLCLYLVTEHGPDPFGAIGGS